MKILIVDDNEDSRMILEKTLEHNRHSVETAPNGVEAMKMAKESPPDMIISDILMPEMDGFRLCREIKQDELLRKIPFVFYTSTYLDPNDERLAMSMGASRFILKPREPDEFLNIINEVFQEYEKKILPVPEKPIKEDADLLGMYEKSIVKKFDEKVRELKLYWEIFSNSNDAIAIIDPEGFYIKQNSAHRALIGYTDEELQGKTPAIHLGKELLSNMLEKLSQQGVYRGELISHTKDGKSVYIELSAFPVANEKGEATCYIGIIRDISTRKRSEEALRLSEEKFSKAFRSSPTFLTISTLRENLYIDVNDAFLDASGYGREEIIGRTESDIGLWVYPADRDKVINRLREETSINNFETGLRIKNGEILTVLFSAELINIEGEQCILTVALDITERKKLENQFIHSQKMEAVEQLAGGIAHDFNNILSAIIGYGHILKMKIEEGDPLRRPVEQILVSSDRAAKLIQGLLAFGRKKAISILPIDLNALIGEVLQLISRLIPENIEIRTDLNPLPDGRPLIALANSGQIEQAVINLVTNARDAMPDGGLLSIKTGITDLDDNLMQRYRSGQCGRYAVITVQDNGTGMDEEIRKKIYDPFFTTKDKSKGNGLGLAMVYGIVAQHNGFIDLESTQDKGTKFSLFLPAAGPETDKTTAGPQKAGSLHIAGTETVLVAEDDNNLRELITTILSSDGYEVVGAVDGIDALAKFHEHKQPIQLVITDLLMPGKSGDELYLEIKQVRPDIKVIILTGYDDEMIHQKNIDKKDLTLLSKPVYPDLLLAKVREVLQGKTK